MLPHLCLLPLYASPLGQTLSVGQVPASSLPGEKAESAVQDRIRDSQRLQESFENKRWEGNQGSWCPSVHTRSLSALPTPGLRVWAQRLGTSHMVPGEEGRRGRGCEGREDSPTTWAEQATVSWPSCSSSCSTCMGGPGARSPPGALRTFFPNLWLGSKGYGHHSLQPQPLLQLTPLPPIRGFSSIPLAPCGV